jgi:hypothetical protein
MTKKIFAIILVFMFSMTVLVSGATGYSDCAVKCMRAKAKTQTHAAMGPTNLQMPSCCSAGLKNTCEMNSAPQVKIPECSIASHPTVSPEWTYVGFATINTDSGLFRTTRVDQRLVNGCLTKPPPIYLLTLSILC